MLMMLFLRQMPQVDSAFEPCGGWKGQSSDP
jgi:hypothetical protein